MSTLDSSCLTTVVLALVEHAVVVLWHPFDVILRHGSDKTV